jgi:ribosome maturation factor RimP
MDRQTLNKIVELAQKHLGTISMDCIDAEWLGGQRILRLFVEALAPAEADSKMDMDDCVKATRCLNEQDLIDQQIEGSYTLEVSSPGLERPLRTRDHFEQFVGSQVKVKLVQSYGDRKVATGKLLTIDKREDSDFIALETTRGEWEFPLESLARANVVYDWTNA